MKIFNWLFGSKNKPQNEAKLIIDDKRSNPQTINPAIVIDSENDPAIAAILGAAIHSNVPVFGIVENGKLTITDDQQKTKGN